MRKGDAIVGAILAVFSLTLRSDADLPANPVKGPIAATATRRVPIEIDTPLPSTRPGERPLTHYTADTFPVQLGVPIREGELYSASQARLIGPTGAVETAQMKVLGRWRKFTAGAPPPPEASISIKWLQVSFNARLGLAPSDRYYLEYGPQVSNPALPSLVTKLGRDYLVDTGAIRFRVNRASPKLFDQVWLDLNGNGVIENDESVLANASSKRGLYFVDESNRVWLASRDSNATLELEESGPQQVTLKATGRYRRLGQQNADDDAWVVRIKAYANKPYVRVFHTIVFNASSEKRRYKDVGFELPLASVASPAVRFARGSTRPSVHVPDQPAYLDNGLGNQWWSTPEIGANTLKVMLHQARHNAYRVYIDDKEVSNSGFHRAGGWFDVSGSKRGKSFGVSAALRWAWQDYPTAFEWERHSSQADQSLRVHLWTRRAGGLEKEGPRLLDFRPIPYLESRGRNPAYEGGTGARDVFRDQIAHRCEAAPYEIPAGLPAPPTLKPCEQACMNATGVGVAKTHELMFEFHRDALTPARAAPAETAFFLQKPVVAHVDPKWLRDSLALGRLQPENANFPEIDARRACTTDRQCGDRKCRSNGLCQNLFDVYMDRYLLEQAVDGAERPPFGPTYPLDVPPDSGDTRAWGDSYGAFDFGDVLSGGKRAHRYWNHTRYFVPSQFWLWFARSGDRRAYEFGETNARHVMDVDTNHTDYDFEYACGTPSRYPSKRRVFRGTPRVGDMGAIHWTAPAPMMFASAPSGPAAAPDPKQVLVPLFTAPVDYASYLATYYYLTGYERARDVAAEIAAFITKIAERPQEEYWKQSESRQLGSGLQAVSDLYELFGGAALETAASKVALDLIGAADSGRELAQNRVSPPPPQRGVAYGFGSPLDSSSTYTFPAAVAFLRLASEETVPKRSQVSRWIQDQVGAITAANIHAWPNGSANHWIGMAAAFHESGDPATLGVGLDDLEAIKASGWNDLQTPFQRGFALYGLPYLMDAIATARPAAIPRQRPPQSSAAELQFQKSVPANVDVELNAIATPHAALPFYPQGALREPPFPVSELPKPVRGKALCAPPCSAAIVVYGPTGSVVARKPYPAATGTPDSRTWYNTGGWVERVTLAGPAGIYRARVEVDGVETANPLIRNGRVVAINDYNKPLYQLFAVRSDPARVKVMAFGGNGDGISPGFRYPREQRQWLFVPKTTKPKPIAFTFRYAGGTREKGPLVHFPFKMYDPNGEAPASGGGDMLPFLVAARPAQKGKQWAAELGPEARQFDFGYSVTANCVATPTPDECKVLSKWIAEQRTFVSSGVFPFYADSPSNYFVPVPLFGPVALSPDQSSAAVPAAARFSWRAVAAAQRYEVSWTDGAACGRLKRVLVSAAEAHCAYGVGNCWVDRPIANGPGQWSVQAQRDDVPAAAWPRSKTLSFQFGRSTRRCSGS